LDQPRFLLDGMLGKLTRWLRLLGYDAEYKKSLSDDELLGIASDERRVLLTRDTELYRRARKRGLMAIVLEGRSNPEDIADIATFLGLKVNFNTEESRCPKCNGKLLIVSKETMQGKVPSRTFDAYEDFWKCNSCGQIYWQGAHWRNIQQLIQEINKKLQTKTEIAEAH